MRLGSRNVLRQASDGTVSVRRKVVARNAPEWQAYKVYVFQRIQWELRLQIEHPKPHERIVFECTWHLRTGRSDCVNCHDLLADALKDAFEIDDKWFLIRDRWAEECQEGDPRVEVAAWKVEKPALPGRGGGVISPSLP